MADDPVADREPAARLARFLAGRPAGDRAALADWLSALAPLRREAGEHLVRAGEASDTLYLLGSGLVRLYYVTPDGRERNKAFYREGQVTGPVSAAMTGSAAPFSIECLEPVEALAFRYPDLRRAAHDIGAIAALYTDLLAEAFIRNEQREAMLLTCDARQRYAWLQEHEGELLARLPQFHIASYLGIDAVSLSRLKRKSSS
jgi:CRP-like cAMP-binding protein